MRSKNIKYKMKPYIKTEGILITGAEVLRVGVDKCQMVAVRRREFHVTRMCLFPLLDWHKSEKQSLLFG